MKGMALVLTLGAMLTVEQRDSHRTNLDRASTAVSADGSAVAFTTYAQLVSADTDASSDVYVLDLASGGITLESGGATNRADASHPGISGNGRFVTFERANTVILRDRQLSVTATVGAGTEPLVTENGTHVVFSSGSAGAAIDADVNGPYASVYSLDLQTGHTRLVSIAMHGMDPSITASVHPTASRDGRYVAFASRQLAEGGRRSAPRVFVRDTSLDVTTLVGEGWNPSLSGDGRFVAFVRILRQVPQIYVADLENGDTRIITASTGHGPANGASGQPKMSADGRFVAFQSAASDLVASDDFNLLPDVFVYDRTTGTSIRISGDTDEAWMEPSGGPSIDAHGSIVAFSSRHPTGASDKRNDFDLYVATLRRGSGSARGLQSLFAGGVPEFDRSLFRMSLTGARSGRLASANSR